MSANSKIEWCDHTFNPWIGCTKVGPGNADDTQRLAGPGNGITSIVRHKLRG